MDEKNKLSLWEKYLTKEIGIEFKACLYFFAILFFYCVYRMVCGIYDASILHLAEMIFSCYLIGYIQVYAFNNFDESDTFRGREYAGITICILLYTALSFFLKWFDGKLLMLLLFAVYLLITYICVILIYRSKRHIDDKILNEELHMFQREHNKKVQDTDE